MDLQLEAIETKLGQIENRLDAILGLLQVRMAKPKRDRRMKEYPDDFERLWVDYPKRAGSNPKAAASRAVTARLKEGAQWLDLRDGTRRYAAYCKATGKAGTEYVMQGARFYGPGREWENDWTPPAKPPQTEDEWYALARERGIKANPGESWNQFKARILA